MRLLLLILFHTISLFSFAQSDVLQRRVSLTVSNQTVPSILKTIESSVKCRFTYASGLVSPARTMSLSVNNKSLQEILPVLLGNEIQFKAKGNYIILSPVKKTPQAGILISGVITDAENASRIQDASIYESAYLLHTRSDADGNFRLKTEQKDVVLKLKISKKDYQDSIIVFKATGNISLQISLKPLVISPANENDFPITTYLVPEPEVIHAMNISDTIFRTWQAGLLPSLSTNGSLNSRAINSYSYNVLGGYSLGTDGAEIAGLFNLNRGDARYFQLAGIGNATGGSFTGFQSAGFANIIAENLHGVQLAGFSNLVKDSVKGAQISGFMNLARKESQVVQLSGFANVVSDSSKALQFTGFSNFARHGLTGGQVSGFLNLSAGRMDGVQIAGFSNVTVQPVNGVQIAGFANVSTRGFSGVQTSGFANIAVEQMNGVQVAGFFNYAKNLRGIQIGVFNYSDSCNGLPIGILSYVNTGYHQIELATDEMNYVQLAFRTGLRAWHTQVFAGIRPQYSDTVSWTFGYGVGSTIKTGERTFIDLDLSARQLVYGNVGPKIDLITNFYAGIEYRIFKWMGIAAGPQLSAGIRNSNYNQYPERFGSYEPEYLSSERLNGNTDVDLWLGWKAGLRFF